MKARLRILGVTALAIFGLASMVHALSITPGNVAVATGNQTSQSQIDAAIAPYLGTSTLLYKQDQGGSESGAFASSYNTAFLNTPSDPSGANITYTSGSIIGPTAFLLVKDGNHDPSWYLFNLTSLGWNGTDTLALSCFWPGGGAISHVSIYGGSGPSPTPGVPDNGMSVMLLGIGLCTLGWLRRHFLVH